MSSSSKENSQLEMDSKKRKRMLSNRESARRSRLRKQQHLDDLLNQEAKLKNDNNKISMQINMLNQNCAQIESENMILRTHLTELSERLRSVTSVLSYVEEFSGMAMDISEIPDQLLEPWQLPSMQSIIASADMFLY